MKLMSSVVLVSALMLATCRLAAAYSWSSTYTVNVFVCQYTSLGAQAYVTLYGNNGYYGHKQTQSWGYGNYVAQFLNVPRSVPGGTNRIDVDLANGSHGMYFVNIYSTWSGTVSFSMCPNGSKPGMNLDPDPQPHPATWGTLKNTYR